MKKKLCKYLIAAFTVVLGFTVFTGCTKEYYTTEEIYKGDEYYTIGSEIITRPFTIEKKDWVWNDIYNRYEVVIKDVKEIDDEIYENGSIIGTVFIPEEAWDGSTYEVQKTLPFVQTYKDLAVPYTEIISFDIFYGSPTAVTFYIQASDGSPETPILAKYFFKVAFVRDSGK